MAEQKNSSAPFTILIVDDCKENLSAFTRGLRKPDRRILTAGSGEAGLQQLLTHEIHLILLDIMMPGMDGFETARRIKSHKSLQHIPIIFITGGFDTEDFVQKAFNAGAVDFITKPLRPAVLKSKVEAFIDRYRQEKDR